MTGPSQDQVDGTVTPPIQDREEVVERHAKNVRKINKTAFESVCRRATRLVV
jgi:hypothetical protein